MIKQSRKIRLPADLYSRNSFYGLLIEYIMSLRGAGEQHRSLDILDVGGYEGKLGWFLPQHTRLTILDRRPAPDEGRTLHVQGDARHLPFPDGHFDLVISSDMLEHLDPADRLLVMREMLRVSSRHVILGGPFQSVYTEKAEELVNRQFLENTGQPHPFLQEHLENGLPDLEQIEQLLAEEAVSYLKLGEGNIYNWYLQQLSIGNRLLVPPLVSLSPAVPGQSEHEAVSGTDRQGTQAGTAFNQFFNEHLFELGNFRAPTYRTVLFCDKREPVSRRALMETVEEKNNFHTSTLFEAYKRIFDDMRDLLGLKNTEIAAREEQTLAAVQQLSDLEDRLEREWETGRQRENTIKLLQTQLEESQSVLLEREQQLAVLNGHLQAHDEEVRQYQGQLEQKKHELALMDTQIRSQDLLLGRLKQELEQLQKSEQELTGLIVLKEESIQQKSSALEAAEQQVAGLQTSLAEYKRELESVLQSRSWKLVRFYGRIKQAVYTRPKNLLLTAWQVLYRLGPREFLRRLRRKIFRSRQNTVSSPSDYQKFIEENELSAADLRRLRAELGGFEYKPLISILMPAYNVPEVWLRKAIKSVQSQIYPKWELCLVDDASTAPHVRSVLQEFAHEDSRIRVHFRPHNGGIVKASNACLKMARGAYVALMDSDDELAPDALYQNVKALQNGRYDLLYSDEDKLELDGSRTEPYFKPDFDADLLFSNNYICHFSVIRRKAIEEIAGFREGTDGSQDYDLILRLTDKKRQIYHIPRILYHWRKIPGSTAASIDAKPYAFEAAKKALTDALHRRGIRGEVIDGLWKGSYRVRREIHGEPLISIIISFRDHLELLKACLDSIFAKTSWSNYEILLVNNGSELLQTREYMREIEHCPRVRLLHYDAPFNYSAIHNFAYPQAAGEYLVLLNADTVIIEPDWLQNMLEHAQRPEVGAVGAKLLYPNGTVQHAGVVVGVGGAANHAFCHFRREEHGYFGLLNVVRQYSAVTAACLMIRKSVYDQVDGMDEENLAVSFNDVDLCLRLWEKGYRVIYTPYAEIFHHESVIRGRNVNFNEEYYLRNRHQWIYQQGDGHYNPNLSGERLDFSLRVRDKVRVQ